MLPCSDLDYTLCVCVFADAVISAVLLYGLMPTLGEYIQHLLYIRSGHCGTET